MNIFARIFAVLFTALSLTSCGKDIGTVDALKTEHFSVSDAMLSYTLYDTYYYYIDTYGDEGLMAYFGLDTTKSLKKQVYDEKEGTTWFDVFLDLSNDSFKTALTLCEAAYDNGIELSDIDKKFIDYEINQIKAAAEEGKVDFDKYIVSLYGKGVKEEDVRKSLEIYRLANKQYYAIYAEKDATDEEIEKYVSENPGDFKIRDVKYIKITRSDDSDIEAKIKEYVDKLKASATVADFEKTADEFLETDYCLTKTNKILSRTYEYSDTTELYKWIFSGETATGGTYVSESDGEYTVYIASSDVYMDTEITRSMYHILFSEDIYDSDENSKLTAENIYKTWQEGDKSVTSFMELASKYTTDYVSVPVGGYYPNLAKGDLVDELNDWLFDEERKAGDTDIIKSDAGYHIVYYSGEGLEKWKMTAFEAVKTEKLQKEVTSLSEKYEVTVLSENFKYIKGV